MPRKVNVMGLYSQTSEEKKAYHWCINNGIFISPFATGEGTWYIDIKINNKTHRSPEPYGSITCLLYTSPSPRDKRQSRMPSSA